MIRLPEYSKVSLEEYNRRLDICDNCEFHNTKFIPAYPNTTNEPLKSCEFCACYMPTKAGNPAATCPNNSW